MPKFKKELKRIILEDVEGLEAFTPPPIYCPVDRDELIDLYYEKLWSTREIAEYLNMGQTTVKSWMKKFKLPLRNQKEAAIVLNQRRRENNR